MTARPQVLELGEIAGDVLVFGAPGSNLQATRAVLAVAEARGIGPAARICTGDAVAYCAQPAETVSALDGRCHWLAGNVERQLAAEADDCACGFDDGSACDLLARGWYAHADRAVGAAMRARMGRCPDVMTFVSRGRRCAVIHGGATAVSRFIWPSDPDAVLAGELAALTALTGPVDAVIAGHCGLAFHRRVGGIDWINAGSVGMPPDDGRRETRFAVLTERGVMIERLGYDAAGAAAAMRAAGLGGGYERALLTGRWPSQEVLAPALRL